MRASANTALGCGPWVIFTPAAPANTLFLSCIRALGSLASSLALSSPPGRRDIGVVQLNRRMPLICIGPVCIPVTALMPIILFLCKPIWVRLPPHVQSSLRTRYEGLQSYLQRTVWDRIGWTAKPLAKEKKDDDLKPAARAGDELKAGMGGVVGLHSDADWSAALQLTKDSNVVMVVDFTAVWCGPCQRIAPLFAELAKQHGNALFVKVDVDELEDLMHSCEVLAMPTFQIYKGGEKVDTLTGANDKKLVDMVAKHVSCIMTTTF